MSDVMEMPKACESISHTCGRYDESPNPSLSEARCRVSRIAHNVPLPVDHLGFGFGILQTDRHTAPEGLAVVVDRPTNSRPARMGPCRRVGRGSAYARIAAHPREPPSEITPPPCHTHTYSGGNPDAFLRMTQIDKRHIQTKQTKGGVGV